MHMYIFSIYLLRLRRSLLSYMSILNFWAHHSLGMTNSLSHRHHHVIKHKHTHVYLKTRTHTRARARKPQVFKTSNRTECLLSLACVSIFSLFKFQLSRLSLLSICVVFSCCSRPR